jgi:subtilisin family serine protease
VLPPLQFVVNIFEVTVLSISKFTLINVQPDVTAPGVDIIAAFTEAKGQTEEPSAPFAIMSGTSMSCPHVSGVVGLLKTLHSHWSPSAIRSAIMTSGKDLSRLHLRIFMILNLVFCFCFCTSFICECFSYSKNKG